MAIVLREGEYSIQGVKVRGASDCRGPGCETMALFRRFPLTSLLSSSLSPRSGLVALAALIALAALVALPVACLVARCRDRKKAVCLTDCLSLS